MSRAGWIALGVIALGGCGREDVQLLRASDAAPGQVAPGADASMGLVGTSDAEVPADAFAPGDAFSPGDAVPPASDVAESGSSCSFAASRSCRENGASCLVNIECCSLRCSAGVCLEAGTCAGPRTACTSRSECCSGRCEPIVGTPNRTCLNYCLADGAACTAPLDCCSMGCHGGVCGAPLCAATGACKVAADCCSGACSAQGTCMPEEEQTLCRATGEPCADDSEDADGEQCCGACDTALGRCGFGAGPCLPVGTLCTSNSDCCRGTCTAGADGIPVCTAPCLGNGVACTLGADCCTGNCSGTAGLCSPPATSCALLGTSCAADGQCCSGQCLGGNCGTSCPAP